MNQTHFLEKSGTTETFFRLLEKNLGISLDLSKEYLLPSRLDSLAKKLGFTGYAPFLENLVKTPTGQNHWKAFEAMTTNETMFFRDIFPFEVLRDNILPQIIERKTTSKELNIWCAAASTGQEPYSLAMILKETFPELLDWNINISATDICEHVLSRAQDAMYSDMEVRRGLTKERLSEHFTDLQDGNYQVHNNLRKIVHFSKINLIKQWPVMPKFDLILIRNVLIYFNKDTRDHVLKKMHSQLTNEGILILGSSESLIFETGYISERYKNFRFYKKDNLCKI